MKRTKIVALFALLGALSFVGMAGAQSAVGTKEWTGAITGSGAGSKDEHTVVLPADSDVFVTLTQSTTPCIAGTSFHVQVYQNDHSIGRSAEVAACEHRLTVHSRSGGPAGVVVENYEPGALAKFHVAVSGLAEEPKPTGTAFPTPAAIATVGRAGR